MRSCEEGRKEGGGGGGGQHLLKSNNPHLAGGEILVEDDIETIYVVLFFT